MFLYTEPTFIPIHYRLALHYGAAKNTPELVYTIAEQAAGKRSFHLKQKGSDGDYVFYLERKNQTPDARTVLFTGTGRCGTKYVAELFTANEIDIGHEVCGLDGCSSHQFVYNADWHWLAMGLPVGYVHLGEHRSDYEFKHVIHLVRNPLTCIPSIASWFHDCDWIWLRAFSSIPEWATRHDLRSAMHAYLVMNEAAEPQSEKRVRIEDIDTEFPVLSQDLFGKTPRVTKLQKANASPAQPQRVSWDTLLEIDRAAADGIYKMAQRYGYEP